MLDKNKRGQVGESMTWIVATLIIFVLLMLFVYASSVLSVKTLGAGLKSKLFEVEKEGDWIEIKNELAFELNDRNENSIRDWIKKVEEKND
jgi:hypothetical protein